jgi:uncharacterized damage-inducible protein DinB
MDLLDRLLGYDAWMTRQILERSRAVAPTDLHRPFDVGHGTFYATAAHLIASVRTWVDLMTGVTTRSNTPARWDSLYDGRWDGLSVDDLIARYDEAMADFSSFARRIRDEGRLDERWADNFMDPPKQRTYGGAIGHVITHDNLHRGELVHILARLGVADPGERDLLDWEEATARDGGGAPG